MYENGKGVAQDRKRALELYKLAAEQSHVDAQFNLGLMYEKGKGVVQDDKRAAEFFKLAADQSDADARNHLTKLLLSPRKCRFKLK